MADQLMQDEAGNLWRVGDDGVPRPAGTAGAPAPVTLGTPDPAAGYAGPKAAADLAQTQQRVAQDAAIAPYTIARAKSDLATSELSRRKAEKELGAPNKDAQERADRESRLNQLVAQVNRVQQLYDEGVGTTKGVSSLRDYAPTDANARFDAAGAALSQQGLAAFRVPGSGTVSDRDAIMFDRANLPTASTRDAAIEEQLLGLRSRVNEERKALGLAPAQWRGSVAAGSTKSSPDPQANAIIDAMVRSGASSDKAAAALSALGYGGAFDETNYRRAVEHFRKNPSFKGSYGGITKQEDTSLRERAAGSAFGTGVASAADAASAGLIGRVAGQDNLDAMKGAYPGAALAGTIAGGVAGAGALEAGLARAGAAIAFPRLAAFTASPRTADALYGGAASLNASPDDPVGVVVGAATGLAGGMFGRGFTRSAGRATRGVRDASATYLRDRGVPLTVGQAIGNSGRLGRMVKGIEDRLTGIPGVGDMVNERRLEGFRGFNRASFNQALDPIGQTIAADLVAEPAVDAALDATGRGYRAALDGVTLSADAPFATGLRTAAQRGAATPTYGPDFQAIMTDEVTPIVRGSPTINGQQFQDLKRTVGGYAGQYDRVARGTATVPPAPMARRVAGAFTDIENELDGLVARQAPDVLPAYNRANGAYRNVQVLKDAVTRGRNGTRVGEAGLFAPSQLADAAAANAKKYGNGAGTTRQPFYELARAGQDVLPSRVADSGTAGRLAVLGLPAALGGAGGAVDYVSPTENAGGVGLGLGALLAAGGTRAGQRALVAALMDRPDAAVRVGNALIRRNRLGGMFGVGAAGAGLPLLLPPSP